MTTTKRDLSELDRVMDFLREHQELHNQSTWADLHADAPTVTIPGNGEVCGTQACVAGWTVILDHKNYTVDKATGVVRNRHSGLRVEEFTQDRGSFTQGSWTQTASAILGLTGDEADELFNADNSWTVLEEMVQTLHDGTFQHIDWDERRCSGDEEV